MPIRTINDGEKIFKDPSDVTRLRFDWDEHFADGAELLDVGDFTITAIRPVEGSPVSLEVDGPIDLASGNRGVDFTLIQGTPNVLYRVTHHVTTNEVPPQERDRSFDVQVKQL